MSWETEGEGPKWLPVLNNAEARYKIPTDLLARVAYQESRFRSDIISGAIVSPAGAVGIMQLMPQFFPSAGINPATDIDSAGCMLANLHVRFGDWQIALAAYNWGGGDVHHAAMMDAGKYELKDMPQETQNYVTQIVADVPIQGVLV